MPRFPSVFGPALLLALVLPSGCGGNSSESGVGNPAAAGGASTGTGGAPSGGSNGAGGAAPTGACALHFSFTTLDNHGRYSPRNVSAVWITDPSGAYLRTLEENGRIRQVHLVQWMQASAGSTVDAVTGATNAEPRAHDVTWDCMDLNGTAVPPGTYTMNAEFATDNGGFFGVPAPFLSFPFDVGGSGGVTTEPDAQYFTGITLTMQ